MPIPGSKDTTQLLIQMARGESRAADHLLPAVYQELRRLAGHLPRHDSNQTLQPTALVHEVYLRLVDRSRTDDMGRTHFFNLAAKAMRQVLADHAKRRRAAKRGGDWRRVTLGDVAWGGSRSEIDVADLDEALTRLAELDTRQARIVELRFLAGMTIPETATALGVSPRTVELDWRMARAWLRRHLSEERSS